MDHRVRNDGSQDRVGQEEENPIECFSFDVSYSESLLVVFIII